MTQKQAIQSWAERWRHLRAWPKNLSNVSLQLRKRKEGRHSTGVCYPMLGRVVVTIGFDAAEALSTVLHEYAHAALPPIEAHGPVWQRLYAAAVGEVTGRRIIETAPNYRTVCNAANSAMRIWWRESGNEFAFNLLTGHTMRNQ